MSDPVRPKLAAIVTTYFKYSHAQHLDRLLDGYGWFERHLPYLPWTWCRFM